jgi:FtsP/CotA-like multicopper oxidase with cupredoxin domain
MPRKHSRESRALFLFLLLAGVASAAPSPQLPLPGAAIPQFVDPLPTLSNGITALLGSQRLTLSICEFKAHVLPTGTFAPGAKPETWVWGYIPGDRCPSATEVQESYLGPVLVNFRHQPTELTFLNQLGTAATTNVLAYRYSTDQTLHWADPLGGEQNFCQMFGGIPGFGTPCAQNYAGPIPASVHLHGGEVPPELDGGPDSWWTNAVGPGPIRGHGFYTRGYPNPPAAANAAVYVYPNTQQAAPTWFHDHTLGATRLNVYAGLAGGYYQIDPAQALPPGFPDVTQVVPIILQDRMFDTNGQLYFPADSSGGIVNNPNPEHPYWVPEFVGDTIVVNGKAWPFFAAEPRRYRFLFLNGSNARTYELALNGAGAPSIWVIGNDSGYLDSAVKLDPALGQRLVIMPGERYEAIIDFGGVAPGTSLILRNTAKTPFPAGTAPQGSTTGRVLQFRIACGATGCPVDSSWNPAVSPAIRTPAQKLVRLATAGAVSPGVTVNLTRQLTLNEVIAPPVNAVNPVTGVTTAYPGGPLEILVNNTKWSGESSRPYNDFAPITLNNITTGISERPVEGATEVWEIVNLTADAHPIHTHLASFQILNRQGFNTNKYSKAYAAAFPGVPGNAVCVAGAYCPGFGPPLHYQSGNPRAVGGNPDVLPFLQGPVKLPGPEESGWKDTLLVPPGMVTRFVIRWGPNDAAVGTAAAFPFDPGGVSTEGQRGYVWHCHIIDHEDNEMMRPDVIQSVATPRSFVRGIDF